MSSMYVPPAGSDSDGANIFDGKMGSLTRRVNFSDHEKEDAEDDSPFDHNNSTLQWETTMNNSLSDDVKLATVAPDGAKEPVETDRRTSLDEGLGTLPSNKEGFQDDRPDQEDEDDEEDNQMPEVASQVFGPSIHVVSSSPRLTHYRRIQGSPNSIRGKKQELGEMYEALDMEPLDPEKQAFLSQSHSSGPLYSVHPCRADSDCTLTEVPPRRARPCGCQNCSSSSLKAVSSFIGAVIIFPCFLYGAYVFLPFDVPLMPAISTRLVYTLRCGVFATFPIVIGLIVYGISRLCASSFDPFGKKEKEVEIHRRYVAQSISLFVLYFFNMAVLATYLPQEFLKLIPLLTGLFALSRLIYWLAFALGRSFRGFGYGLTFLPLATMLICNLYFMFILEPQDMFAVENAGAPETATPASKLRLWG